MKKRKFKIPIYFGTLIVIKTNDFKAVIKKYGLDKSSSECDAFVFRIETKKRLRYFAVFKKHNVSNIAHEAVHIVSDIFRDGGIIPDVKNDEPQAYLTGWVANKIHKTLK